MQVHFGVELCRPEWQRAVVCIGTFDGVHLGHQHVIEAALAKSRAEEVPLIVVTFDRHPMSVLNPGRAPKAIASLKMNLERLQAAGVGLTIILPFNAWLSRMSAEEFFQSVLVEKLHVSSLVIGHDFAFGNGREGNAEWLADKIDTIVVPAFDIDGVRVSSSAVRELIAAGETEQANAYLGRGFEIQGFVEHGQKLGREIGFPTANIARSFDQVMPKDGIYAAYFFVDGGKRYVAAVSIGMRPTVDGQSRTIEAYLLDYPGDSLYGKHVRLRLEHYLHPELKYDSIVSLKEGIARDVEAVRALLP